MNKKTTIILPVYNEGDVLKESVLQLLSSLDDFEKNTFSILIAENGSTDASNAIASELTALIPDRIELFSLPTPDYGLALLAGMRHIKTGNVFVFQVDSAPMDFIAHALGQNKDFILGSRRHPNTWQDDRPFMRKFFTYSLNQILKICFRSPFYDTHGIKFMNLDVMLPIAEQCRLDGGIFETEMAIRAHIAKVATEEVPIAVEKYSPPKRSYFYKILNNLRLVFKLFKVFIQDGLYFK